jgi:hypothetical protein
LSPSRSHPDGTNIARNEHKKFEHKQLNTAAGVQEGAALAPAEGQLQDTNDSPKTAEQLENQPSFRFPPKTAIAGVLIDRWAKGEMDEVEVSSMKNRL